MASFTAARWWQPSDPKKFLPGVLFEDEEHGWVLELDGYFQEWVWPEAKNTGEPVPLTLPDGFPILVGSTSEGKFVSLLMCQVLQASPPLVSRGSLRVRPIIIAYDVHFDGLDDFRLVRLSIRYSNLDAWAATSGFSMHFDPSIYPVEVKYSKPKSLEVEISDGMKIGIGFSASGPSFGAITEVRILQQSWLTVTVTEDLLFQKLWDYLNNLSNLISLGVGKALRALEMTATCHVQNGEGSERSPVSIKLVHNQKRIALHSREVPQWDMLFTLPEIRERFGELVKTWFSRDAKFQSLYDLYFGTVRSSTMHVEHRFLNMFQALESYDRRSFEHPPEKMLAHKDRLERILSAVQEEDKKWLEQKLQHSHEPAASDRIRRLVRDLNAKWLLTDEDIKLAGDFRNYYTHFDSKVALRLPPLDERFRKMRDLAIRLQVLCELQLLVASGLPLEYVSERMAKTRRLERRLGV